MMEHITNYFSFNGCVNRKRFLVILIALICLSIVLAYVFSFYVQSVKIETTQYLIVKRITTLVLTLIWLPAVVKRLHDIGATGIWSILLAPPLLLDLRNVILFKELTKIEFNIPISIYYTEMVVTLIFIGVLFFMPSNYWSTKYNNPNKALKRDSAKSAEPLS